MNAYEISPDDEGWPHNYCIDASHKWGLPGVRCGRCGFVGGAVGSLYPAFSLPSGVEAAPYLDASPVSPEQQSELQRRLLCAWGQQVRLSPGSEFGPLVGKAWGKCGDVAWVNSWTPLLATAAAEKLRGVGIELRLVPTELKWRSKSSPEYLELHILPGLKLSPSYLQALNSSRCGDCGISWQKPELPDRATRLAYAELENDPVLDAASLPSDWALLRIEDWEGTIAASERFKSAVVEIGLTNITFRELRIGYAEALS